MTQQAPSLIPALVSYIPPAVARLIHADPRPLREPHAESFPAAVLLADISGFTALTEKLAAAGPAGAEELTQILNGYFTRMIGLLEQEGGEVVQFSGDSLIATFPSEADPPAGAVRRAWQAAEQMQRAMDDFATIATSAGPVALGMKVAVGAGPLLALSVGGALARWQYIIAGDPLRQVAEAEHQARRGEILLSPEAQALWSERPLAPRPLRPLEWPEAGESLIAALRTHIPGAISHRLLAGQADWLSELRRMSVLFLGIGGLGVEGPEALTHVQAAMTAFQETVYRYEGSINKLLVDDKGAIAIVLFGAPPLAHVDDPLRAVLCAADIHRAGEALDLRIAIGITTGQLFAGAVGSPTRREYTVIGDVVNLAARLMQSSGRGLTTADHTTYQATRAEIAWEPLGPLMVKGKVASVRAYRPRGLRQGRPPAEAGRRLIGRAAEVGALTRLLDASAGGATHLAIISGEAGLGKTRLIQEFAGLVRARGLSGLLGSAQAIRRRESYQAWHEIFESYFDIEGLDDAEERRRRVRERLAQVAPHPDAGADTPGASPLADRAPLLNDLLDLGLPESELTAGLEPKLRQASLTALLIELLERWASERPLVLVLEDAHWLDSLAWDLTLQVARALAGRPLLLLIALRPLDDLAPEHPLQAIRLLPISTSLDLAPLSAAETLALASARLEDTRLPPLVEAIFAQQSGGNPFVIEELALSLRETGAVRLVDGRCEPAEQPTELQLPDTLQGLVLSRIDRLPAQQQLVIKVAAIIGRIFGYPVLRDVYPAGVAEEQLREHLDGLGGRDLVERLAGAPSLRSHSFKQAIVQEVTYTTILNAQRRELHAQVARWYERNLGDDGDAAPMLAYHWRRAGNPEHELRYTLLAAHSLAAAYANREALAYLARAAELSADPAQRYPIFRLREQLHERLGDTEARRQDLVELEALAEALAEPGELAQTANAWAAFYRDTSDYTAATAALERAVALARGAGDREREARSLTIWGQVFEYQGAFAEARAHFEQALAIYRATSYRRGEATNLSNLGNVLSYIGEYQAAREHYQAALAIREQIGDRAGEVVSLNNLGQIAIYLGEMEAARGYQRRALELARAIGDRSGEALILGTLGDIGLSMGDYAGAQANFEESVRISRIVGERRREASGLNQLGMVWRDVGERGRARGCFEQALAIQQAIGDQSQAAFTCLNLGYILLPDAAAARRSYEQALALARATGSPDAEAYALGYTAALDEICEDWPAAEAGYTAALAIWEELGAGPPAIECRAGLGRAALAHGRLEEARAVAEACSAFLEEHGPEGIEFPLKVYLTCYDILRAAGDPAAAQLLEAAQTLLMMRAHLIGDPQLRAGLLGSSAESRRVLASMG